MRNNLTWLHISDIHFHQKTEWRDSITRRGLVDYLRTLLEGDASPRLDLVFCTGDIAYGETGSAPLHRQYKQAKSFFEELLAACGRGGVPLSRERLYVVPGNHDVNRTSINADAQATLTQYAKSPNGENVEKVNQRFEDCTIEFKDAVKRLDEYSQFVKDCLPHQQDPDGRNCYAKVVKLGELLVGVAGFNSAWSCAGRI